jgi:hypothetical protein
MSKNLLTVLDNEKLLNNFKLICVDDNLNNIPPAIKKVPTMIVVGYPTPIVASETFDWIQKVKYIKGNPNIQTNNNIGPIGYKCTEMGGFSDIFAYKDVDNPMPQSFYGINDDDKNVIFTAPEQDKISKKEQEASLKDLKEKREAQNRDYALSMKKAQLQAVQSKYKN